MGITERIDNVTKIPPSHLGSVIPAPRSVKIELTGRCNFRCSFCARSDRLRKQADMDPEFYRRVIREFRDAGVEELGLFYLGESFLVNWLSEAIRYAKVDVGFPYVFLTTNGSLSGPDRLYWCMKAGLDSLKFSLNYADRNQFEDIARVKGDLFWLMVQNIKDARRLRDKHDFSCGLYASYIRYDDDQRGKMESLVEEVTPYLDEIYELPLYNQAGLVSDEEEKRGWVQTAGNRGRVGALRDPLPCWACFTEGHVTWDGKLSACCFDHDNRFHMADLNETSFIEGWNSLNFQELRSAHLKRDVSGTACEVCVAYS